MTTQTSPAWAKPALEYGPIMAFFVAYLWLKDDVFTIGGRDYDGFILVTAGFVPLMLISTGLLWRLTGKLSKMQIVTVVLIVVFGGLTVWLNDDRFFKMKPTLIYLLFGGILGLGLLRGQSYLRVVMEEVLPLDPEGWMKLTRRLCAFFFGWCRRIVSGPWPHWKALAPRPSSLLSLRVRKENHSGIATSDISTQERHVFVAAWSHPMVATDQTVFRSKGFVLSKCSCRPWTD